MNREGKEITEPRPPQERLPDGVHLETMGRAYRDLDQRRFELEKELPALEKDHHHKSEKADKAFEESRRASGALERKEKEVAIIKRQLGQMCKTQSLSEQTVSEIEGKEPAENLAHG